MVREISLDDDNRRTTGEKAERVREHHSPSEAGRRPEDRSRDRLSSRGGTVSESVFGDREVVDPWGNWQRTRDASMDNYGKDGTHNRKRESQRTTDKKPRSGRRATSWRRDKSSSQESGGKRRNNFRSGDGQEMNANRIPIDVEAKVKREEKRLMEKKKYEEERLEQVKRREERILRDEKHLQEQLKWKEIDAQNKIDFIKREERRVKKLEEERLKRERDLYLREKKLKEKMEKNLEDRRNSPKRRERSPQLHSRRKSPTHRTESSNGSSRPPRSRHSDPVVTLSLPVSPMMREVTRHSSSSAEKKNVSYKDASSSPPSHRRSPFRRSPSFSTNYSVLDRLGPKIPVRARLGFKKRSRKPEIYLIMMRVTMMIPTRITTVVTRRFLLLLIRLDTPRSAPKKLK
eukprot:GFUD01034354.1.p1 GENE.GFUD01034354.1~~GFUD01034354.1.p1  ORF type:complete len:439 (+),score=112.55 GFUD01034354.1:110-1318(+)